MYQRKDCSNLRCSQKFPEVYATEVFPSILSSDRVAMRASSNDRPLLRGCDRSSKDIKVALCQTSVLDAGCEMMTENALDTERSAWGELVEER